ncbi:hypothetical protein K6R56_002489 [Escherichia coli]|nr:hypothetical protein [Escherichia coli]
MKDEVERLVKQFQILESAAAEKTGAERAALQKRAAEIKMEIIKLLPKQGQQTESKIPDPNEYFGDKLPDGFGDYFSGDYLTKEQRDYFTVQVPDNMPDERPSTETPKSYEMDADVRKRILNALGIPC